LTVSIHFCVLFQSQMADSMMDTLNQPKNQVSLGRSMKCVKWNRQVTFRSCNQRAFIFCM